MQTYEYKVVPAPRRGKAGKGIRGSEAKFANALSVLMNELGAAGWDYVRADTLPVEERRGIFSHGVVQHSMLVFRRPKQTPAPVTNPLLARPKRQDMPQDPPKMTQTAETDAPSPTR